MRTATPRHFLMCAPTAFTVSYRINPWMDPETPTDTALAVRQWDALRETYLSLGHRVSLLDAIAGLPDMVYTANGATVVGGTAHIAAMTHPQRQPEEKAHAEWFASNGFTVVRAKETNEGEGDFLLSGRGLLAGTGLRTTPRAHAEAAEVLGVPTVTLHLVDPRFYHLDTALAVLDQETVAYYPSAFSEESRALLAELFPDAVLATDRDAEQLGLNVVSDGANVVLAPGAVDLAAALRDRGFTTHPVDTSELLKGGGGAKCCTLEVRSR